MNNSNFNIKDIHQKNKEKNQIESLDIKYFLKFKY